MPNHVILRSLLAVCFFLVSSAVVVVVGDLKNPMRKWEMKRNRRNDGSLFCCSKGIIICAPLRNYWPNGIQIVILMIECIEFRCVGANRSNLFSMFGRRTFVTTSSSWKETRVREQPKRRSEIVREWERVEKMKPFEWIKNFISRNESFRTIHTQCNAGILNDEFRIQ